jgi:hypothetical protein
MPISFDYDITGGRSIGLDCPCCDGGWLEVEVKDNKTIGRIVRHGCPESCETDIANGKADEAILAAIAEADQLEQDTDWSEAWERRAAGSDSSDLLHIQREAQGLKQ